MAICKNRFLGTSLFFATLVLLILESYCHEKTLRKIVRNQSKMVQRPFSDAGTGSDFSWKNLSVAEGANKVVPAISFKVETNKKDVAPFPHKLPSEQVHNRPRAKVFKYLSAIDTARSKGSLTRSSVAKIGLANTNISHIGRLVRNPFASNPPTSPISKNSIETVVPQPSLVNVFDNINENKGNPGGGTDDYYVTKNPDYFSKEEAFDEPDSDLDGESESTVKPKSKPPTDIDYNQVKPIDFHSTIDHYPVSTTTGAPCYIPVKPNNRHSSMARDHYPMPTTTAAPCIDKDRRTIYIPVSQDSHNNESIILKSFYSIGSDATPLSHVANQMPARIRFDKDATVSDATQISPKIVYSVTEADDSTVPRNPFTYNPNLRPGSCTTLKEVRTDIDLQEKFSELDLEPQWCTKRTYWDRVFDNRYVTLMHNPKWPALKVILIPITHVDTIWKRTFDQYQTPIVAKILSNLVKKLLFYTNMTFSWHEVSHLSQWWSSTSQKNRMSFKRLVKSGRLEITTGGWVEPDEATSHIFALVHQLMEGHQWLKATLNYTPKVAWLTNTMTHSPTMPYLLAASEIWYAVMTNVHYSFEKYLAEYQYSDFLWLQSWDSDLSAPSNLNSNLDKLGTERIPKHAVLTHYMQFNSAGFRACGPNKTICSAEFDFAKMNKNLGINVYNVKEKAELLLEQYSKTGTTTSHNVIIAPVGGLFRYDDQTEFDYQYGNYHKLAEYINENSKLYKTSVDFGTVGDYFKSILHKSKTYPSVKGDFMNFADIHSGKPAYWTGYFTTRPMLKILLRRLQSNLRTTEILFSFAISYNAFESINTTQIVKILAKARVRVARLSDRNVDSGALPAAILKEVYNEILSVTKECWNIQEICASLLTIKPGLTVSPVYLQKYVYRDGEFISVFRSVVPGDQLMLFNALSQERTEVIELISMKPNLKIIDHMSQEVPLQVNPMWKYSSNNMIKLSKRYFKIVFLVVVPPMTLSLYKVAETYSVEQRAAMLICSSCEVDEPNDLQHPFPFTVQEMETGDIQLENYKNRLTFDGFSGFLKSILQKETNNERKVTIHFGAFRSSAENSGMFLFSTNATHPMLDILQPFNSGEKSKIILIISGAISTEISLVFGTLLQHTVKIYNIAESPLANAISVESKLDMETSPKNRDLEIFLSIQTDINNGIVPEIFTDNNGFQYTPRYLNISRRVESNMYPITTMAYLQDETSRLTLITDHAQGVTALQEGQLTIMMDRRVLFSDGRGVDEGVADSSGTTHRHYILLEELLASNKLIVTNKLPSSSATYLSNALSYPMDMYLIDKSSSSFCHVPFLPMIMQSFPCDVSVLNFRAVITRDSSKKKYRLPTSALLVLHRQSFTCRISHDVQLHCGSDSNFYLDRILRNAKGIYKTNLCGTGQGVHVNKVSQSNFPPMELITLRVNY